MKLIAADKQMIESIIEKVGKHDTKSAVISFPNFYRLLSREERVFCKRFLAFNPRDYGFLGPRLGVKPLPRNLAVIQRQKYTAGKKKKTISPQYAPASVYGAFKRLQRAMLREVGKKILVESGYRSPAYQLFTFFFYLRLNKWDINKTCARAAMPGYSEHGDPKTALDFITEHGLPSDDNLYGFTKTLEYKWLLANAGRFGFFLSYPKDNPHGVMFEPWHWRYAGAKK